MNGWTTTKVFRVNGKLTIADTIEKAIELYRKYAEPDTIDIRSVEQVLDGPCGIDGSALTIDVQDLERHYAEQLAKLTEECELLKQERKHVYVRQRFDKETIRKNKLMAAEHVARDLGWVLAKSSWVYCELTEEEEDNVWMEMGMFVQELPPEKYGHTVNEFLGLEDDRQPE